MLPSAPSGPDLAGVIGDANAAGLSYVVIGGFSVIAHGYVRATRDSDLLVPDGPDADAAIVRFLDRIDAARLSDGARLGLDDVAGAHHLRMIGGQGAPFASLRSLVGFKRLADRTQDRADLEALERIHGELPVDSIPGLDS
jgi:hypothetical protein